MKKPILLLGLATLLAACSDDKTVELAVANPAGGASLSQLAAVPAAPILERLGADYVYVADASGREIPSQITYDGLLLFPADVAAGSESIYTVGASDTCRVYPRLASGRLYPERADDIAWENEAVGFRIYGPATQAAVTEFQKIFHLPQTGSVDFAGWYEISSVFVAVTEMA